MRDHFPPVGIAAVGSSVGNSETVSLFVSWAVGVDDTICTGCAFDAASVK